MQIYTRKNKNQELCYKDLENSESNGDSNNETESDSDSNNETE